MLLLIFLLSDTPLIRLILPFCVPSPLALPFLSPHTPSHRESDEYDDPRAHPAGGNVCGRYVQAVPPSPALHFPV